MPRPRLWPRPSKSLPQYVSKAPGFRRGPCSVLGIIDFPRWGNYNIVSDTATLGKPAGSDAAQGKNTYPALVGLDESRRLAREQADAACAALTGFSGPEAEFLRALAGYTITRAA